MRITAFVGSVRKMHTYNTTELFLEKLKLLGDIEYEIVQLSNYNLETCKGCLNCMDKGEEYCPLKDDRDLLIEKMKNSDGVIFASPNYCFQVSALMKTLIDRLGFFCHRPYFFGKSFTSIVAQGIYGGNSIVKYLNFIGGAIGFNVVKGCCINSLEPMTDKGRSIIDRIIDRQSRRFYKTLIKKEYPQPRLFELMVFRMSRSSRKIMLNEAFRDYTYCKDNGWFETDYYYPVRLSFLKGLAGHLFDKIAVKVVRNR